ncbi:MAG: 5'-methylthioadenosine/S-adenosylhomocysteine nucleosidase, partial [Clostridia bacterium]
MYGIIAAMQEEMKEIKKIMQNIENKEIYELNFFKGTINDKNVVLVEAGVGKVNAARVTQILIDNFKVEGIINVGSAGSCNDELEIGDIVIGKKLVQHDFDITAFGHEKGFISNVG